MIEAETGYYFDHVSAKAVILRGDEVLLCLNPREEWELPGGWPDQSDASLKAAVVREVREETGLDARVDRLIDARFFERGRRRRVVIIAYLVAVDSFDDLATSEEHSRLEFHPVTNLPPNLPELYTDLIRAGAELRT